MESPGKLDSETRGCVGSVAVIGAGVSGLTAAYKLKAKGLKVTVFEAEDRAGGKIRSSSQDGFLWDEGANTMTETEKEVTTLIDDLGLREKQQIPLSQNKRYIAKNGFPEMVPSNPLALIKSNFLSTKTKFQVLLEPFMWRKPVAKVSDAYCTESVGQFFQRHFGKEVVDLLIDPFVAGTSGGDPDSLSMRHAFPEIWNIEKKFGSIILGARRSKSSGKSTENDKADLRRPRRQRGSFSFLGGMQILTDTLCLKLGAEDVKLHSEVLSLSCQSDGYSQTHPWSVSYTDHGEDHSSDFFDAVIMTAPLRNVQEMKFRKGGIPFQLNFLPKVNYLPLSVLITAFKKENIEKPLEGFGVLIPSQEQKNGLRTLGTLFSSMMFPDRAPGDQYLYTTFIGGSRNKDLAGASLDELRQITLSDLRKLIGAKGQPTFMKHVYWENAFPLYSHDYDSVLEGIGRMEENLPGFFYAGNHRDGLSVGKAIVSGCRAADQVLSYICGVKQDS